MPETIDAAASSQAVSIDVAAADREVADLRSAQSTSSASAALASVKAEIAANASSQNSDEAQGIGGSYLQVADGASEAPHRDYGSAISSGIFLFVVAVVVVGLIGNLAGKVAKRPALMKGIKSFPYLEAACWSCAIALTAVYVLEGERPPMLACALVLAAVVVRAVRAYRARGKQ